MSFTSKNTTAKSFNDQYSELTETDKYAFSRLCNKLLNENFIYGQLQADKTDYYAILKFRDLIENYFDLIDYQLSHDDTRKIFFLESTADRNRIKLKKIESVLLVLLRRAYYVKSKETVDSNVNISITIDELIDSLVQTNIYKDKLAKTQIIDALKVLKRFKLINFDGKNYEINNVIEIFPMVSLVVKINDIDQLNIKLKTYKSKEDDEDETDED
jgi:hypothetical protein